MIIGIDMGGTHTDGVLVQHGHVEAVSKVATDHDRLHQSLFECLDHLLVGKDPAEIRRIVFSTTLTTNLIARDDFIRPALILVPGPGMNPEPLRLSDHTWILSGSVDHRGRVVADLVDGELDRLVAEAHDHDCRDLAIVGKFSVRNPFHEDLLERRVQHALPQIDNIQLGSRVAPRLNYPRRVHTTWLNTAAHRTAGRFFAGVEQAVRDRGISAQLLLLKADGGTMPLDEGKRVSVQTIKSGPSASIMGFLAISPDEMRPALLLDVGGTTTDLGLMVGNAPLFEPGGVRIGTHNTSVRGLLNRSIPYGGDSSVSLDETGAVVVQPRRIGPAAAFGGTGPTVTDALIVAGLMVEGNYDRAADALRALGRVNGPGSIPEVDISRLARNIVTVFNGHVRAAIQELLAEVNGRPIYTVHELLSDHALAPQIVMMIGGPAEALLPGVADDLGLEPVLTPYHRVANALGAAAARPTVRQGLYVDTAQGFYILSGQAVRQPADGGLTMDDARRIVLQHTRHMAEDIEGVALDPGLVEITHEEQFNVVRGFYTDGRIFRLVAQIRPGIDRDFAEMTRTTKGGQ
jgi:N-methylhydantoinase A/oxoprolinase/acetone carboxylase beta subunit